MLSEMRPAIVLLVLMTLLTGIAYPLTMTGLGQTLFPRQANASLLTRNDGIVGSEFVGQTFTRPGYFHGRPSAAGYDAASSGATNLGPTNHQLVETISGRVREIMAETGASKVPVDLVTSSGSGLDPDISPESAYLQIDRVGAARNIPADELRAMIDRYTDEPLIGIFGAPAVNVLKLNLALDERTQAANEAGPANGPSDER